MPPSAPLPVRSTCVSAAGEVGGTGKSPLDSPPHPRCAVVGCHPDRRHRDGDRVCNRRRIGPQGANPRLYRLLYRRLRGGGPGRPAVGPVHRARPAATDTFCAVPGAYWLFHGGTIGKFKDLLINCGYSLIERFPLMLGTAAGVLLIGLVRWYLGTALFDSIARKLSSLMTGDSDDDGGRRSAQRPARTRSRHARPPSEDNREPIAERRSRRRPRPQNDPHPRRNAHERPAPRSSRFDSYRSYQPSEPPGLPSPSTGTNVGVLDTSPMRATSPPTSPNADAPVPASQPTRHTIRSRRSATAGQLLATRGGTTTARSSGSIGGIVRGHRADHRLNPGNTTSNRERMCSAR